MEKPQALSPMQVFLVILAGILGLAASTSLLWEANFKPEPASLDPDFEVQMMQQEAALPLNPGVNKTLRWVHEDKSPTPRSLVFLHGFSATRKEIAPLPEMLAERLGMNLFMTRLTGHGMDGEAMGKLTAEDLLRDAEEAMAVGRRMGKKVVLLGVSTGGTLALTLARRYPEKVDAMVLLSPNFRPSRGESLLLKGPFGKLLAKNFIGDHSWQPDSLEEEMAWTTRYPALAIHEMMDLLSWVNEFDLSKMKTPLFVLYSDVDRVVSVERMHRKFQSYGGPKKIFEVTGAHHVLAGAIKSPETTELVFQKIVDFLEFEQTNAVSR